MSSVSSSSAMSAAAKARSIYRSMLRELPRRPLKDPSPVKLRIRAGFAAAGASGTAGTEASARQLHEAEQFVQYARAQRLYATLLDRYNPGMNMSEEERHRLTVRRVGMNMPQEWKPDQS